MQEAVVVITALKIWWQQVVVAEWQPPFRCSTMKSLMHIEMPNDTCEIYPTKPSNCSTCAIAWRDCGVYTHTYSVNLVITTKIMRIHPNYPYRYCYGDSSRHPYWQRQPHVLWWEIMVGLRRHCYGFYKTQIHPPNPNDSFKIWPMMDWIVHMQDQQNWTATMVTLVYLWVAGTRIPPPTNSWQKLLEMTIRMRITKKMRNNNNNNTTRRQRVVLSHGSSKIRLQNLSNLQSKRLSVACRIYFETQRLRWVFVMNSIGLPTCPIICLPPALMPFLYFEIIIIVGPQHIISITSKRKRQRIREQKNRGIGKRTWRVWRIMASKVSFRINVYFVDKFSVLVMRPQLFPTCMACAWDVGMMAKRFGERNGSFPLRQRWRNNDKNAVWKNDPDEPPNQERAP